MQNLKNFQTFLMLLSAVVSLEGTQTHFEKGSALLLKSQKEHSPAKSSSKQQYFKSQQAAAAHAPGSSSSAHSKVVPVKRQNESPPDNTKKTATAEQNAASLIKKLPSNLVEMIKNITPQQIKEGKFPTAKAPENGAQGTNGLTGLKISIKSSGGGSVLDKLKPSGNGKGTQEGNTNTAGSSKSEQISGRSDSDRNSNQPKQVGVLNAANPIDNYTILHSAMTKELNSDNSGQKTRIFSEQTVHKDTMIILTPNGANNTGSASNQSSVTNDSNAGAVNQFKEDTNETATTTADNNNNTEASSDEGFQIITDTEDLREEERSTVPTAPVVVEPEEIVPTVTEGVQEEIIVVQTEVPEVTVSDNVGNDNIDWVNANETWQEENENMPEEVNLDTLINIPVVEQKNTDGDNTDNADNVEEVDIPEIVPEVSASTEPSDKKGNPNMINNNESSEENENMPMGQSGRSFNGVKASEGGAPKGQGGKLNGGFVFGAMSVNLPNNTIGGGDGSNSFLDALIKTAMQYTVNNNNNNNRNNNNNNNNNNGQQDDSADSPAGPIQGGRSMLAASPSGSEKKSQCPPLGDIINMVVQQQKKVLKENPDDQEKRENEIFMALVDALKGCKKATIEKIVNFLTEASKLGKAKA